MKLALVGGTGPEGLGLALRFAKAGMEVIIGSRKEERAQEAAHTIKSAVPNASAQGLVNRQAVTHSDIVIVTVPYGGQKETLTELRDVIESRIVVDTVVPLSFSKSGISALPVQEGSATQEAQALLPQAKVVGAFHNLSATELAELEHPMESDVVVVGNDAEAKKAVMSLAQVIPGVRAIDGGGLQNARYVEDITALLLNINKIYKAHTSIKIVGL
ncbi:MAG: NADPH-dependent F420 reductase [Chloroflexi bacterium]|nr:NADPH-dependent F420 reductase [Chloroflexota bacterium]